MKQLMTLRFPVLIAFCVSVGMAQAAPITYAVSIDLSSINPGSSYSGSVTLPAALSVGQSTPITLAASPANQYSPNPLTATLGVGSGPSGFNSVFLSQILFTDAKTSKQYNFIVDAAAHCDVSTNPTGVPCQTAGQFTAGNANGGFATYSVSIGPAASIPEPGYGMPLMAAGLLGAVLRRRRSA